MRKYLLMMLNIVFLFHLAHAYPATIIRFGTEATYPPFEYTDAYGKMKGFDIDIANALCEQMKVQCTFSNQSFNSLMPSLILGKYDAVIAALGVTPEREKEVRFTQAYYEPSASFVGDIEKFHATKTVNDRVVGVQQGSTFEGYLHYQYGNSITIKSYASIQEAFLDLDSGRVDAVMTDTAIAKQWIKESHVSKRFGMVAGPIVDHAYFGSGYAIAVSRNNTVLLSDFNKALIAIKKNGLYKKIYDRYFGDSR